MNKPIIGFAGNGHLMEHAAAAAYSKGFKRITYTPVKTGDSLEDLRQCDIVYICPDRPSNISPDSLTKLVIPHLRDDAILVIHCQVELGFTRKVNWPHVYYHVETLRMSDAMDRAVNPERIVIGAKEHIDKRLLEFLYSFHCPVIPMSYESAELAKIAINIYLAAQVSVTNTLSELAKEINADWDDVIPALQTDKRIGREAYLKPGYGLSQHLTRDLKALIDMNGNMDVIKSFLGHSEYRRGKSS